MAAGVIQIVQILTGVVSIRRREAPEENGTYVTMTLDHIAFIGFGEAAGAFLKGWRGGPFPALAAAAYDIKTDDLALAEAKWADYARADVKGCASAGEALAGADADAVFSLVTADQALIAAGNAAPHLKPGALYFDGNSCAPGTKRRAAEAVHAHGGRYVDMAIMAPVYPKMQKTPVLLSGPHAEAALAAAQGLDMAAKIVPGDTGAASSIKMIRSVMMKGLEALVLECVLAGRKAGVDVAVLDSLDVTYPDFDWKRRAAYMMERVATHGVRRAAEMREVALTVDELGLGGTMARAAVEWQERVGALRLKAGDIQDYGALAEMILASLDKDQNQ